MEFNFDWSRALYVWNFFIKINIYLINIYFRLMLRSIVSLYTYHLSIYLICIYFRTRVRSIIAQHKQYIQYFRKEYFKMMIWNNEIHKISQNKGFSKKTIDNLKETYFEMEKNIWHTEKWRVKKIMASRMRSIQCMGWVLSKQFSKSPNCATFLCMKWWFLVRLIFIYSNNLCNLQLFYICQCSSDHLNSRASLLCLSY